MTRTMFFCGPLLARLAMVIASCTRAASLGNRQQLFGGLPQPARTSKAAVRSLNLEIDYCGGIAFRLSRSGGCALQEERSLGSANAARSPTVGSIHNQQIECQCLVAPLSRSF
ncbi:MAG TPA: hypothetical protein VMT86_16690 [Bryobacteraceae bacterium]|nr:hypothetical protein [Bryobacteraceae bacterium]